MSQDPERHLLVQEKVTELREELGETSTPVQTVNDANASNIENWAAELSSSAVAMNGHDNQIVDLRGPEPQSSTQSESTSSKGELFEVISLGVYGFN